MARQRFIHPTLWEDPVFGQLQPNEQLLFVGLFSLADDEGRIVADPAFINAHVFTYKDYTNKKVQQIRDGVVEKMPSVHLYRAAGVEYIALLKWKEYQKPKYPKASKIPPPFLQDSPKVGESMEKPSVVGWVGLDRDGMDRAVPSTSGVAADDAAPNGPDLADLKEYTRNLGGAAA